MATVAASIDKLKRFRAAIANPIGFFEAQLAMTPGAIRHFQTAAANDAFKWIGIAQATARDVIFFALPANTDPYEWGLVADYIASQVGIILAPGGRGIVIFLGERQAEFSFASIFGSSVAAAETLSLDDLTEYVEAGLRGDPAGKPDISAHDQSRTARQTAFNLLQAFHKRNFGGEREQAVVKFIEARSLTVAEDHLPAILEAWHSIFSVIAPDDFKLWIEGRARAILT